MQSNSEITKNFKGYLASGWFNNPQEELLELVTSELDSHNLLSNFYQPVNNQHEEEDFGSFAWQFKTYRNDIEKIEQSDIVLAVLSDKEPDSGTIWEIAYAHAKGIPVVLVTDSTELNLMLVGSIDFIIPLSAMNSLSTDLLVDDYQSLGQIDFDMVIKGYHNKWIGTVE